MRETSLESLVWQIQFPGIAGDIVPSQHRNSAASFYKGSSAAYVFPLQLRERGFGREPTDRFRAALTQKPTFRAT